MHHRPRCRTLVGTSQPLAPMSSMKVKKAAVHATGKKRVRSMNKAILCKTVAEITGFRPMDVRACLEELQTLACTQVAETGRFEIPGVVLLRLQLKPTRREGAMMLVGRAVQFRESPARKIVKCTCLFGIGSSE